VNELLPDIFYDLNIFSIILRLVLALLFGGLIGLERGAERHPAGFRTHILVCVGAALAMITNQYMVDIWPAQVDPSRIGAQVITGVGFLGAGTIILTGRNRIRGLTTAAGLWASACIGLAVGIGFYSGALIGTILIYISLELLPHIESAVYRKAGNLALYIEVTDRSVFKTVIDVMKEQGVAIEDMDFSRSSVLIQEGIGFSVRLRLPRKAEPAALIEKVSGIDGVTLVDEE
jgi:putative Mg2+ transporter-C (MgtC) family protein